MRGVRGQAREVSCVEDLLGPTMVDDARCEEGQGAVVMLVVVPGEQLTADVARVLG